MFIILLERQDNMSNRIGVDNILKYSELLKLAITEDDCHSDLRQH